VRDPATGAVHVMSSTYMNALLPHLRDEAPVLSTWNPLSPPDPRHVVSETVFERPLMTLESDATHEVRLSVCLSGRTDGWAWGESLRRIAFGSWY
jgi:predicted NAD/FAD-binding protein